MKSCERKSFNEIPIYENKTEGRNFAHSGYYTKRIIFFICSLRQRYRMDIDIYTGIASAQFLLFFSVDILFI